MLIYQDLVNNWVSEQQNLYEHTGSEITQWACGVLRGSDADLAGGYNCRQSDPYVVTGFNHLAHLKSDLDPFDQVVQSLVALTGPMSIIVRMWRLHLVIKG